MICIIGAMGWLSEWNDRRTEKKQLKEQQRRQQEQLQQQRQGQLQSSVVNSNTNVNTVVASADSSHTVYRPASQFGNHHVISSSHSSSMLSNGNASVTSHAPLMQHTPADRATNPATTNTAAPASSAAAGPNQEIIQRQMQRERELLEQHQARQQLQRAATVPTNDSKAPAAPRSNGSQPTASQNSAASHDADFELAMRVQAEEYARSQRSSQPSRHRSNGSSSRSHRGSDARMQDDYAAALASAIVGSNHATADERQMAEQLLRTTGISAPYEQAMAGRSRPRRSQTDTGSSAASQSRSLLGFFASRINPQTRPSSSSSANRHSFFGHHQYGTLPPPHIQHNSLDYRPRVQYPAHNPMPMPQHRPSSKKPASVLLIESLPTFQYKSPQKLRATIAAKAAQTKFDSDRSASFTASDDDDPIKHAHNHHATTRTTLSPSLDSSSMSSSTASSNTAPATTAPPIAELEATAAAVIASDDDAKSCNICFMEYEEDSTLRLLPCFHSYHKQCCDQWLSVDRRCPICLTDVKKALIQHQ